MSLKALDSTGLGTVPLIDVINYAIAAKQAGVNLRVLNVTWSQTVTLRCYGMP